MIKFSARHMKNDLLKAIIINIVEGYDNYSDMETELIRYKDEYPFDTDYNYVQDGNLLIYYDDIRDLYVENGYKLFSKKSDNFIWSRYKLDVGECINLILNHTGIVKQFLKEETEIDFK